MVRKFKNLIGCKFYKLTVHKHCGCVRGNHLWECSCECGGTIIARTGSLNNGRIKSCGCLIHNRVIDLTDQTFGNLTVIKRVFVKMNKNKQVFKWLCKCKCGNETKVSSYQLRRGKSISCGCLGKTGYKEISGVYWGRLKSNAKARNLEFNITKEFIWNLFIKQNKRCALTNWPIELTYSHKIPNTASLDRKDSTKGYTEDNIQWVHVDVNFAKQEYSIDHFLDICKYATINNSKINIDYKTIDNFNEEYW